VAQKSKLLRARRKGEGREEREGKRRKGKEGLRGEKGARGKKRGGKGRDREAVRRAMLTPCKNIRHDKEVSTSNVGYMTRAANTDDLLTCRGQSKGERGGTAFPHLLFSVCIVPPPEF